jgi:hypothetical protein
MFSVADARRFIAAGFVVVLFRTIDLSMLHMRSASHNTERHGSDTTRGVRIGLGTHANLNLDSAGTQRTTSDGGGAGAIVRGGGTPAHEGDLTRKHDRDF